MNNQSNFNELVEYASKYKLTSLYAECSIQVNQIIRKLTIGNVNMDSPVKNWIWDEYEAHGLFIYEVIRNIMKVDDYKYTGNNNISKAWLMNSMNLKCKWVRG